MVLILLLQNTLQEPSAESGICDFFPEELKREEIGRDSGAMWRNEKRTEGTNLWGKREGNLGIIKLYFRNTVVFW
jgi:hypothetical protein